MKLSPRPLIVAACAAAPFAAFAQSNVTIYGRIDLSIDNSKTGSNSAIWLQKDNASRLGFKGTEDIGGGIKAHFGLEMGLDADTGTATTPMYRNSYVALQSDSLGVLGMGRIDSATPTGSPLYSLVTQNVSFAVHDAGATAIGTKVMNIRNRFSNSVSYKSPDFNGFVVRARVAFNGNDVTGVAQESDLKNYDIGLGYNVGELGLGFGLSEDRRSGGALANDFKKKWIGLASYKIDPVKVYGVVGSDTFFTTTATRRDKVPFWLLGASTDFGGGTLTGNFMQRAVQSDVNGKLKKFQVSYAYKLSKRSQVYALYDNENPNSNATNNKIRVLSAGIQHNF